MGTCRSHTSACCWGPFRRATAQTDGLIARQTVNQSVTDHPLCLVGLARSVSVSATRLMSRVVRHLISEPCTYSLKHAYRQMPYDVTEIRPARGRQAGSSLCLVSPPLTYTHLALPACLPVHHAIWERLCRATMTAAERDTHRHTHTSPAGGRFGLDTESERGRSPQTPSFVNLPRRGTGLGSR